MYAIRSYYAHPAIMAASRAPPATSAHASDRRGVIDSGASRGCSFGRIRNPPGSSAHPEPAECSSYLRDESLPVKVRITNRSGQELHLGREADWLNFIVENRDGSLVRRRASYNFV